MSKKKPSRYTKKFIVSELNSLLNHILADESILFKGQLFINKDYSRQRYSEWRRDYRNDQKISDTIKRIDEILESRVVVGALTKELQPSMAIFHLKCNYMWNDTPNQSNQFLDTFTYEDIQNASDSVLQSIINQTS